MNIRKRLLALSSAALLFAWVLPAIAAPQRTFVASTGADANPCTLTLPCRTFAAAVAQTADLGEVIALDSAGYGPVTIDSRALTIAAPPGVYAGISVFTGNGVTISGVATVTLRNIAITGVSDMGSGIVTTGLLYLSLDGVTVSGFKHYPDGYGLYFAAEGWLAVANSVFEQDWVGIKVAPPISTVARVMIQDTRLIKSAGGYVQSGPGTTRATIVRTNASQNYYDGFGAVGSDTDSLVLESCVASENQGVGVANGAGVVVLSANSITGNGYSYTGTGSSFGVYTSGGAATQTRGNNTIAQNATDIGGTPLVPIPGGGS